MWQMKGDNYCQSNQTWDERMMLVSNSESDGIWFGNKQELQAITISTVFVCACVELNHMNLKRRCLSKTIHIQFVCDSHVFVHFIIQQVFVCICFVALLAATNATLSSLLGGGSNGNGNSNGNGPRVIKIIHINGGGGGGGGGGHGHGHGGDHGHGHGHGGDHGGYSVVHLLLPAGGQGGHGGQGGNGGWQRKFHNSHEILSCPKFNV